MTRREFSEDTAGGVAGIAFGGCGLLTATVRNRRRARKRRPRRQRRRVAGKSW